MASIALHPQTTSLRLQLHRNLLLHDMTPEQWAELEPMLSAADYGKGEYLVRQGDYPLRDWMNAFLDEFKRTGRLLRVLKEFGLDESFVYQ